MVPKVIYNRLMGGALPGILDSEVLERADTIRISTVIYQERVWGADLRVIVINGQVVASVALETPHPHLDFRGDESYTSEGHEVLGVVQEGTRHLSDLAAIRRAGGQDFDVPFRSRSRPHTRTEVPR